MNNLAVLCIIPAFLVGFAAFWCLLSKLLSLPAWHRLAKYYVTPTQELPPEWFRLARAKMGAVSYQGVIKAGVLPQGLALRVVWLFQIGHPPLLIPWSAFAPIRTHKILWTTTYSTSIRASNGQVHFRFSDQELVQALSPWLRVE